MNWRATQNPDGGWAYGRGCSWTEPTVFALLAQSVTGVDRDSFAGGLKFLRSVAGPDGGYRPQLRVEESTWVTSAVALLPEEATGEELAGRAIGWLKGQTGRESSWSYRLRQRFAGNKDEFPEGWPWFPGAAAWVIPTSLGILAFERALRRKDDSGVRERIDAGREFLLKHMCADGGWNHGSNQALGRDGESYPETTGVALLALHGLNKSGSPNTQIERAKAAARTHLRACRTAEGIAWLSMALAVHGEKVQREFEPVRRTSMDYALMALASAERNPLL